VGLGGFFVGGIWVWDVILCVFFVFEGVVIFVVLGLVFLLFYC